MSIIRVLEKNKKVKDFDKSPTRVKFNSAFAGPTLPTDLVRQIDETTETETMIKYRDGSWVVKPLDGSSILK